MPGPTTERLDEDFRAMREDFQDFKVILARMDAKLSAFDDFKLDVKVGFETLKTEIKENYDSLKLEAKENYDSLKLEAKENYDSLRAEIKDSHDSLRLELKDTHDSLRLEVKDSHDSLRAEVRADFGKVQDDLKINTASITALEARVSKVDGLFNVAKWALTTFTLAGILGVINISGRLIALELQSKGVERRLNAVETEIKSLTERQGVVEVGLQGVKTDLGAVKGAIDRRAPDTAVELDDRIKRITWSVVEDAVRKAATSKP